VYSRRLNFHRVNSIYSEILVLKITAEMGKIRL
jgi:hypothetical protein